MNRTYRFLDQEIRVAGFTMWGFLLYGGLVVVVAFITDAVPALFFAAFLYGFFFFILQFPRYKLVTIVLYPFLQPSRLGVNIRSGIGTIVMPVFNVHLKSRLARSRGQKLR